MSQSIADGGRGRLLLQGRSISRGPSSLEVIALVVLGLAMAFVGYKVYASATDLNAPLPTAATYIPAFETTLNSTISASGSAAAGQQAALTFGSAGEVTEVLVNLGESVAAGEPLARIEDTELQQSLAIAEASLASAQARLDAVLEGASASDTASALQSISSAQGQVLTAEANLDEVLSKPTLSEIAAAEQSLLNAQTALQNARDALVEARSDLSNPQNLEGVSSGSLERAIESAELGLVVAQQKYDETLAGPDAGEIQSVQLSLETARASLGAADARYAELMGPAAADVVAPLEASLTQAKIAVENAASDLEAATIVAPFDGLVSEVNLVVGDRVSGTAEVIVVMNPDLVEIESSVDQSDIINLAVGQSATVTFDAMPGRTYNAEVSAIGPAPSVQQGVVTFPVNLTINTADLATDVPLPAPGMTASILVTTERVDDALVVPSRAVSGAGRQQVVTVKTPAGDEVRPVTTGTTNGTLTQILSGLEPGDEVLVIAASTGGTQTQQTTEQQFPGPVGVPGGGGGRGLQAP